jgi:RNA polymerase sigma-70 factor (ECF subfamily)
MATDAHAVVVPAAMDGSDDDPEARVAALFDAHYKRLFRLARRLVRDPDDPADVVQETFLRAARAPHRVPPGAASEEAWLVRVLINVCKDSWRHAAVRVKAAAAGHVRAADAVNPEPALLAHSMVWQALDRLPARRRAVLVLYELDGTPIPEIARLIGVTPVTVRWHLMRARRELASVLGDRHE